MNQAKLKADEDDTFEMDPEMLVQIEKEFIDSNTNTNKTQIE